MDQLKQLRRLSKVVADTGEIAAIDNYRPEDATTNPSLILKAAQMPAYTPLIETAVSEAQQAGEGADLGRIVTRLFVHFGVEIARLIPGYISTEVDASASFDIDKSLEIARTYIDLYQQKGIATERVLIKLAATWEGIEIARQLEQEGIKCNITLIFSQVQAVAAAEAGATLISPFVGRVSDYYHKERGEVPSSPEQDPGVLLVKEIYHHFKTYRYPTEVMGASFRNVGQILALAGLDRITIAPPLLEELATCERPITQQLTPDPAHDQEPEPTPITEQSFRWLLNENLMATVKLAEGISRFAHDMQLLKKMIQPYLLS